VGSALARTPLARPLLGARRPSALARGRRAPFGLPSHSVQFFEKIYPNTKISKKCTDKKTILGAGKKVTFLKITKKLFEVNATCFFGFRGK